MLPLPMKLLLAVNIVFALLIAVPATRGPNAFAGEAQTTGCCKCSTSDNPYCCATGVPNGCTCTGDCDLDEDCSDACEEDEPA